MKEPEGQKRFVILAGIVVISVILLVVYLSWAFVDIILLSLFGAYMLSPLEKWLKKVTRINDPRITAALTIGIVLLVFFAIFTNIIFVISHELSGLTQNMQTDTNGIIDFWMSLLNDYIPVSMQSALKERFSSSVDDA